nr:hypothetical protein Iba_chr02eCG11460 [Ipomoea batatas]
MIFRMKPSPLPFLVLLLFLSPGTLEGFRNGVMMNSFHMLHKKPTLRAIDFAKADLDLELGIVDGRNGEESWSSGADLRGDSSARLFGKGDGD